MAAARRRPRPPRDRPATVTDPDCRRLLDRLRRGRARRCASGTRPATWASRASAAWWRSRAAQFADPEYGNGCHPAREVALLRALTEAAQARTTYISGTRDDFPVDAWEPAYRRRRRDALGRDLDAARRAVGVLRERAHLQRAVARRATSTGCSTRLRAAGIDAGDRGRPRARRRWACRSCASWCPASKARTTRAASTRPGRAPGG